MDAAELRLGNYVNVPREDQSPFRIDAFEHLSNTFIKVAMFHPEHGENFHPLTWYGEDLKPILLTKEWLLNFGFKRGGYDLLFWEHSELKSVDFAGINWADEDIPEYQFLNVSIHGDIIQINYVHQLQNFYFTLTGKELIILS